MISVRPAVWGDREAIWDILEPVFRAGRTYAVDPEISKADALTYWAEMPRATFVACDGDDVLGTFYVRTNQAGFGDHICNCGYIVAQSAQGRGVASAMCNYSLKAAKDLGYLGMQFNLVLASNHGAARLWHRLGFDTVGTIPRAFRHPDDGLVDAYVMYRDL